MNATVSPQKKDVYEALRGLFQQMLPPPVPPIILGLGNRVATPKGAFIAMTAIGDVRLETNIDTDVDGYFTGGPQITQSMKPTRLDIQIDFYGPNAQSWALMTEILFRDDYAFEALEPDVAPLYADDPIMVPLVDGEDQYLNRWTVTAAVQFNPITVTAQSFSTTLNTKVILVDEEFHP